MQMVLASLPMPGTCDILIVGTVNEIAPRLHKWVLARHFVEDRGMMRVFARGFYPFQW